MIFDAHASYVVASYTIAALALGICTAIIILRYRRALQRNDRP